MRARCLWRGNDSSTFKTFKIINLEGKYERNEKREILQFKVQISSDGCVFGYDDLIDLNLKVDVGLEKFNGGVWLC